MGLTVEGQDFLHGMLENGISKVKIRKGAPNCVLIPEPTEFVDCAPERDFGNFVHLTDGDALVYAEVANTTPLDGHEVLCKEAVQYRASTSGCFTVNSLERMRKELPGTAICHEYCYHRSFIRGRFFDSWIRGDSVAGHPVDVLCGVGWVNRGEFDAYAYGGLAYIAFSLKVDFETCCMCGRKFFNNEPRCGHLENKLCNSVYNFVQFYGFSFDKPR